MNMHQPSRRQFVAASLAGLPVMALGGSMGSSQGKPAAPRPDIAADPVLDHINASLRELYSEGENKPGARREVTRAIEATLGVQAAHIARHYDPLLKEALRQREQRLGRPALVEEMVAAARRKNLPNVTHELVDEAVSRIARYGLSGCIRDGQRTIRAIRLRAPDAVHAVSMAPAQYDFCSDLAWIIEVTTMIIAISCVLAFSPAFELALPVCWAAEAYMAGLLLMKAWWC
jgi:hypothetical protein